MDVSASPSSRSRRARKVGSACWISRRQCGSSTWTVSAAEPAADHHLEAELARLVLMQIEAEIVHLHRGTVFLRSADRDLEFARQEREFGMQRRPLPDDLGIGTRILELVGGNAGERIGRRVAERITAGLDRVHFDARQLGEDVGVSSSLIQCSWRFCRVVKWP